MNPVCPGFMAHHVKPNRCRRCFRDMQDHDANKDVSTTFTIPLPRRRRESVSSVTETSKTEEISNDSSASFIIRSLDRKPRQRSVSTSSWFQEKKDIVQKDKFDALFKNVDEPVRPRRNWEDENGEDRAESPVFIRRRWRPIEHPTMTKERQEEQNAASSETANDAETYRTRPNKNKSTPMVNSNSLGKIDDAKSPDIRKRSTKISEEKNNSEPPKIPPKDAKTNLLNMSNKTAEKKMVNSEISQSKVSESTDKSDSKTTEKKPVMSRFLDSPWQQTKPPEAKPSTPKPAEPKPTEARRDSKVGSVLLKFEAPSVKDKPPDKAPPQRTRDSSVERKSDIKPVLRRFSMPKTEEVKAAVEPKTKPTSKPKPPVSSSSEESESEEEPKKPPAKPSTQKVQNTTAKVSDVKPSLRTQNSIEEKISPFKSQTSVTKTTEQKTSLEKSVDNKPSLRTQSSVTKETEEKTSSLKSQTNTTKIVEQKPPLEKSVEQKAKIGLSSTTKSSEQKSTIKLSDQKFSSALDKKNSEKPNESTDVAFVVKLKPSPTPSQDDNLKDQQKHIQQQESKITDLQKTIETLKKDLKKYEENYSKLEREKTDIQKKKQQQLDKDKEALEKSANELSKMRNKVMDMQSTQEHAKDENKKLKSEMDKSKREADRFKSEMEKLKSDLEKVKQEMDKSKQEAEKAKQEVEKAKQEAEKHKLDTRKKETTFQQPISNQRGTPDVKNTEQLKQKLQQTETLCQDLMEENEDIKKEVRDLEQELEELHDNFREDQASEFRGLKKELETATKNCRVLQFKLRKSEKRCEQLEVDRHSMEDKVKEYQLVNKTTTDSGRTKELENELKIAKSLAATLSSEVDTLRASLQRSEIENEMLRQDGGGRRSLTPTSRRSRSPVPVSGREGMATPLGKDYESLTRELYDTMERESDLREQLKFSEEEAKTARRKMSTLEQENETLMLQMKKLNTLLKARKNLRGGKDADADEDEDEELTADNLKLQLDLQEQEMGVMRRKLEDTEKENESLQSEVKYLQEKVINQPLIPIPDLPENTTSTSSTASAYWEKKARLLEYELKETRKKTIEKEREIDRLNTEVEIYRKKASKMMVRSRSLDSDIQVDLKRQLQLVEQEASILRQKVTTLENENDKLTTDNKRLNLRVSRKPPLTSQEMAQLENLELKQKNEDLQRKLETLKQEFVDKAGPNENPVAVLQDYKPRRESLTSLTDNENDLIQSLKKKLKCQEDEQQAANNKFMHLEIEHNRLSREHRRLKEALSSKKKPMKAIRDSATRIELKELITELQDEISELQVSLRGREVMQDSLEEELERSKKELRDVMRETKQKEDKLKQEVEKEKKERETLLKEAEAQKKRASTAESQLNQVSGQLGADQVQLSQKLRKLEAELAETVRKEKAGEDALEKKTRRLRETQEKLNSTTTLKEDLSKTNRLLQSQKDDLSKELDEHKELLTKAESRIKELRNQMDNTDRDVTSLRKECNQLRNELEDERSRLKQLDKKSVSEGDTLWTKERDDLRRMNAELRAKAENLQHQITHNEQIYIEKEARLREEFKRKKEVAVRDAREKGEAALSLAKEEEKIVRSKLQEISDKLEKAESAFKEAQEKARQAATQHRRDKDEWSMDKENFEGKIRAEVKKRERAEREQDQALKHKEEELIKTKDRVVQLEREQRRTNIQIQEADQTKQKCSILEKETDKLRQEYEDLTSKYDQLEEEFVKTKAKFVQEKETSDTKIMSLQRDVNNLSAETVMIKDNNRLNKEGWNKEKAELQEHIKETERRLERVKALEQDRSRLKNLLDEKETLIESYKKEEKHLRDERDKLRKNVDDMSRASEAQRQAWIASASSGKDPKAAKEVLALKADYEGKMMMMNNELSNMQAQISNLCIERDELRCRLITAERSAEEFKTGSLKREKARHREEAEVARRKVKELRHQLEEVKEQMEDTILENKNLRLQIETDRNSSEIEISELKSKINQLEEQKILETTRGQTRNLARTRLELAWEKERSEQQHLLTESHKLVKDLKSRLEAAELEREKEKQALRREVSHVREVADKDQQENRRKMTELHSSLLEIRESQAKLRGLYDRMKREREILMSERDEWRQKLQLATQVHAMVQSLQSDVEIVTTAASSKKVTLTTEINEALTKVKDQFVELQKSLVSLKDDERFKRTTSFRRAVSAQEMNRNVNQERGDQPQRITYYPKAPPSMVIRPPPRLKALHRKSLSLDHTLTGTAQFRDSIKIWESEGESAGSTPAGSLLSLRMGGHYGYESDSSFPEYGGSLQEYRMRRRYLQTPSGLSTDTEGFISSREGSVATSCESVPAAVQHPSQQKKSSTLKDKLKLLRRAKSTEVTNLSEDASKEAKEKSLRSKISQVLKKPLGRSISMDVHRPRGPALPPKGVVPDNKPKRPTSEKPLSASRGELSSTQRPLTRKSPVEPSKSGRETPV